MDSKELDKFFKFEIGQKVKMKGYSTGNTTVVILERGIQDCSAGPQMHYTCRIHTAERIERLIRDMAEKMNDDPRRWGWVDKEFRIREMELESMPLDS